MGGALNDFQFTGEDFFADKSVCSVVLELPHSALGAAEVGLWQRTMVPADGGGRVQVDRGAHTQQVTFVIPNEEKAEYLGADPADVVIRKITRRKQEARKPVFRGKIFHSVSLRR